MESNLFLFPLIKFPGIYFFVLLLTNKLHMDTYNTYTTGHVQIDNNTETIQWQPISTRKSQLCAISRRTSDFLPSVAWTFVIALPLRPLGLGGNAVCALHGSKGPAANSLWQRLTCASKRYTPAPGERSFYKSFWNAIDAFLYRYHYNKCNNTGITMFASETSFGK